MVTILPSEDCVFRLDSKYGFSHASNLPVTYTDVTLDDQGFGFNGTSSYIDCGNDGRLNITNEITLEAIIYFSVAFSTMSSSVGIVSKGIEDYCLEKNFNSDGLRFRLIDSGSSTHNITTANGYFDTFKYYHIIGTYDGTNQKLYINGAQYGSDVAWSDTIRKTTNNLTVGKIASYFNGCIKNVSIYNRALTAQEVADRYNKYTFGGHL